MTSAPRGFRSKGRPGDRAIVDEAAFVDDLAEVLKAAMAFRIWGGTVHILSTHNGEASPFNTLARDIEEKRRPGSLHKVTFADAIDEGLGVRRFEVIGEDWTQEAEDAWVEETRAEHGEDAAEELDCIPSAGAGTWLSWGEIRGGRAATSAGLPEQVRGQAANHHRLRRRPPQAPVGHAWVIEMVPAAWRGRARWSSCENKWRSPTRTTSWTAWSSCYKPYRIAIDQTGMGEKQVEDAQRRHGSLPRRGRADDRARPP